MRKAPRALALALSAAMTLSLAACGGQTGTSSGAVPSTQAETEAMADTMAATEAPEAMDTMAATEAGGMAEETAGMTEEAGGMMEETAGMTEEAGSVMEDASMDMAGEAAVMKAVPGGMVSANGKFYTDYATLAEEQQAAKELAVQIAEEGDVLLKNENGALPLSASEKRVTLFGMATIHLIEAGGGSGAGRLGNNDIAPSTVQSSLEDAGFVVNQKTIDLYNKYETLGTIYNELPIENYGPSVTATYKSYGDAAIITIDRIGAENVDCKTNSVPDHADENEHYLQLDDNERALVAHVKQYFDKVIVLINSANIMEIPDLAADKTADNLGVDAILWVGTTGNNCIDAVGRILNGQVNPSGHTVDLWSADFKQDPTFTNFGHDDQNFDENGSRMDAYFYDRNGNRTNYTEVEYREDIYMGYRYYETVAADKNAAGEDGEAWYQERVLYPFGYGLSYTTFDCELVSAPEEAITDSAQPLSVSVKVTNTGDVAGKDVVQLYYTAPYNEGGIEKAATNFVQFEKTDLLAPGESQVLTLSIAAQDLASYDYSDANGNDFMGWELEAGTYTLSANKDSHTPVLTMEVEIPEDILCETDYATGNTNEPVFVDEFDSTNDSLMLNKLTRTDLVEAPIPAAATVEDRTLNDAQLALLDSQDTYEVFQDKESDPWYVESVPEGWTQAAEHEEDFSDVTIKFADMAGVAKDDPKWTEFMNQLTWTELCDLVTTGTGAVEIPAIGKAADSSSDGPVQISGGTLYAGAPITAATYNKKLAYEMGRMVGNECIFNSVEEWLGPGCDIHRSPFSGRNFEYYSEDGVQGGLICAQVVKGATEKGIMTMLKHYFANDSESYRADYGGICTFATEQALREIYLRGFEYAVKFGGNIGMMSSFNRIGYVVTSGSYATCKTLLRDQLGFEGFVVGDAWTKDYAPLNMYVRGGTDEVLGSGASYAKNDLTRGEWSPEQNVVLVPADMEEKEAGMNSLPSPTHYYNVRTAAQNMLYARANSIANNNCLSGAEIVVNIMRGVNDSAGLSVAGSTDVEVTVDEGFALPEGLEIANGAVVGNTMADEGSYTVNVSIVADGWVQTAGTLTVNVVSAVLFDGENITAEGVTVPAGDISAAISSDYYAYGRLVPGGTIVWGMQIEGRIINCYYNPDFTDVGAGWYNRNEDKTAADIITHDAADAVDTDLYRAEVTVVDEKGKEVDGVELKDVVTSVMGQAGAPYEATTSWMLEGNLEAGDYTVTVDLYAPTVACMNNWLFISFGHEKAEVPTYTESFTLHVE